MDWNDTPEQAAFRTEVRQFIAAELPAYYRSMEKRRAAATRPEGNDWMTDLLLGDDEARAAAADWNNALLARGWAQPGWPKEYGGGGLSTMEQFILKQELTRAEAPEVGSTGGGGQIGPTLLVHGTEEQKRHYLPGTLSGEYLWAQGYSEPGAGSDLASLQTRAVRDGDEWVINGQKMWTSNAHKANWVFLLVRTDPQAPKHRGISFLMADIKSPGITIRPIVSMGGWHVTNEVFYENVRIPADQMVGEENRGWYVGMTLLDYERSAISGAMQQQKSLGEILDEVRGGRTPSRRELVRAEIADRHIEIEVNTNLNIRIATMQARGMVPNYEASMVKAYSSELSQRLARTGVKTFGLYGLLFDAEEPLAPVRAKHVLAYVGSVVGTIAGGSNEIQRNIIATRGLGLPRG
ncbi:MAG: acyl-CoA dehydrogenase family protein [Dehalococcoidia bacterium]|nr:acyl-CoA dehydrogenase family protein [Dehalococcoidia bacterium]